MKKAIIIICAALAAFVLTCNIIVVCSSNGRCYTSAKDMPTADCGILFGTGRSAAPSPYYDARVTAAIDLLKAHKIDTLVISGENLYPDYHEVDSMAAAIRQAVPDAAILLDTEGVDTYASLHNTGEMVGYDRSCIFISQHFHNQRSLFYAGLLYDGETNALDACDTQSLWWRTRNVLREWLARTKAVIAAPFIYYKAHH